MTEKITPQSPVIRLPQSYHRKAKAWAALQGLSLRQAMCLLIDRVYTSCVDLPQSAPRPDAAQEG